MGIPAWQVKLLSAIWAEAHKPADADRFFRSALLLAQDKYGPDSAVAGLVLIDFQNYLDRQGRHQEAAAAQKGICRILKRYRHRSVH